VIDQFIGQVCTDVAKWQPPFLRQGSLSSLLESLGAWVKFQWADDARPSNGDVGKTMMKAIQTIRDIGHKTDEVLDGIAANLSVGAKEAAKTKATDELLIALDGWSDDLSALDGVVGAKLEAAHGLKLADEHDDKVKLFLDLLSSRMARLVLDASDGLACEAFKQKRTVIINAAQHAYSKRCGAEDARKSNKIVWQSFVQFCERCNQLKTEQMRVSDLLDESGGTASENHYDAIVELWSAILALNASRLEFQTKHGLTFQHFLTVSTHIQDIAAAAKRLATESSQAVKVLLTSQLGTTKLKLDKVSQGTSDGTSWKQDIQDNTDLESDEVKAALAVVKDAYCDAIV
jgi:hypothetical protein